MLSALLYNNGHIRSLCVRDILKQKKDTSRDITKANFKYLEFSIIKEMWIYWIIASLEFLHAWYQGHDLVVILQLALLQFCKQFLIPSFSLSLSLVNKNQLASPIHALSKHYDLIILISEHSECFWKKYDRSNLMSLAMDRLKISGLHIDVFNKLDSDHQQKIIIVKHKERSRVCILFHVNNRTRD